MRILITNDDGIRASGLEALVWVAKQHGEVKIAAPDRERSGCSHGMTLHDPLRVKESTLCGCQAWEVSGMPVDCVNVGLTLGWPDGCDLVLSGFNLGPNLGFDVTYSGTVGGALEGSINGIRSIALSMATFVSDIPDHLETGARWLTENWHTLVEAPLEPFTLLNVNIPSIAYQELRGHRVCRMGERVYADRVEVRHDPAGRPYYWQGGVVVVDPTLAGSDVQAVSEGFVAITPITVDWTRNDLIDPLAKHFGKLADD